MNIMDWFEELMARREQEHVEVQKLSRPVQKDLPERKHDFALIDTDREKRIMRFYATPELAKVFRSFGNVEPVNGLDNRYFIFLDWRYDFEEVIAYAEYLSSIITKEEPEHRLYNV